MECEVVIGGMNRKGTRILETMAAAGAKAGVRIQRTSRYKGNCRWLMTYGLGHTDRARWMKEHLDMGGRVIGWDLGYWNRKQAMRVTIDDYHPWRLIADRPGDRWAATGIQLRDDHDPSGYTLVIGMGNKSRFQLGYKPLEWEEWAMSIAPPGPVAYRPKKPEPHPWNESVGTIESALKFCKLVICRHSNVAIDAHIAGVPVICQDGAAYALYQQCGPAPSYADRLKFLQNLAYWQYQPSEADKAWNHIIRVLSG